jgi:hypothetical protein
VELGQLYADGLQLCRTLAAAPLPVIRNNPQCTNLAGALTRRSPPSSVLAAAAATAAQCVQGQTKSGPGLPARPWCLLHLCAIDNGVHV